LCECSLSRLSMLLKADWELCLVRLGLGDKLQLACTEKKGRAQAIQVHGASVMLPTGEPFNCHAAYW